MDIKKVVVLAILYFVITMPFSMALEISIFSSSGQRLKGVRLKTFSDFVNKDISFPYDYETNLQFVKISLTAKEGSIEKMYLYKCKRNDPSVCIEAIEPVIALNPGSYGMYLWNDISEGSVANIMILLKMKIGNEHIWLGSWEKITMSGAGNFGIESYDVDGINLYLKQGISSDDIESYLATRNAVPISLIDRAVINSVNGEDVASLYILKGNEDEVDPAGTSSPSMQPEVRDGNIIRGIDKAVAFVFADTGKISNPVLFYSAPLTTTSGTSGQRAVCGNNIVEEGEECDGTSDSACPGLCGRDCKCLESSRLVIDDWQPKIIKCSDEGTIEVNLHVERPQNIGNMLSYRYLINGNEVQPPSITCVQDAGNMYSYTCNIKIREIPNCNKLGATPSLKIKMVYAGGIELETDLFAITIEHELPTISLHHITPNPFKCDIDSELEVGVEVKNEPTEQLHFYYTFDGEKYSGMRCNKQGDVYRCKINKEDICGSLEEEMNIRVKLSYGDKEVLSDQGKIYLIYPPPSIAIDSITPSKLIADSEERVSVLLHVNYPDMLTYSEDDFSYKYINMPYAQLPCTLSKEFENIKYYRCSADISLGDVQGIKDFYVRLTGYQGPSLVTLEAKSQIEVMPKPPEPSIRIITITQPFDCAENAALEIELRVNNEPKNLEKTEYSLDGDEFKDLSCSRIGESLYKCTIAKEEVCDLVKDRVNIGLRFTYPGKVVSGEKSIIVRLPSPYMIVYAIHPSAIEKGKLTEANVYLYVEHADMLAGEPRFIYSYLDKSNKDMTCTKQQSGGATGTRDYYSCKASFDIPRDVGLDKIDVIFQIEGTDMFYASKIKLVSVEKEGIEVRVHAGKKVEIERGNETTHIIELSFTQSLDNLVIYPYSSNDVTIRPLGCENKGYYSCTLNVAASKNANVGMHSLTLKGEATLGEERMEVSIPLTINILPTMPYIEITSVNPSTIYCPGAQQRSAKQITINAQIRNVAGKVSLYEESIMFAGKPISSVAGRSCTINGFSITCNIGTEDIINKCVEMRPDESKYFPLSLSIKVRVDGKIISLGSASKDIMLVAPTTKPALSPEEENVSVQCIKEGALTINLELINADLLHEKEEELRWSFRINARSYGYGGIGRMDKGRWYDDISCVLRSAQTFSGGRRSERYECNIYITPEMFTACTKGYGSIEIKAEGKRSVAAVINANFFSDKKSVYDLAIEKLADIAKVLNCQIISEDGDCRLERSILNTTIQIINRQGYDISDLRITDAWVTFDSGLEGRVNCRKRAESNIYRCEFQIPPHISFGAISPDPNKDVVKEKRLGRPTLHLRVKYASGLLVDTLSYTYGDIKVIGRKSSDLVDSEKIAKEMNKLKKDIKGIIRKAVYIAGICVGCVLVNKLAEKLINEEVKEDEGAKEIAAGAKGKTTVATICNENEECLGVQLYEIGSGKKVECIGKCIPIPRSPSLKVSPLYTQDYTPLATKIRFAGSDESSKDGKLEKIITSPVTIGLIGLMLLIIGEAFYDIFNVRNGLTKTFLKGSAVGVGSCLILEGVGMLEGEEGWKGRAGKAANVVNEGIVGICTMLGKSWHIIVRALNIVMQIYSIEMCLDSIGMGARYYGGELGKARKAEIFFTTYKRVYECLSQFDTVAENAHIMAREMARAGRVSFGKTLIAIEKSEKGRWTGLKGELCNNQRVRIRYSNLWKYGTGRFILRITGSLNGDYCEGIVRNIFVRSPMAPDQYLDESAYGSGVIKIYTRSLLAMCRGLSTPVTQNLERISYTLQFEDPNGNIIHEEGFRYKNECQ